jgi:hypothetical protein
MPIIQTTQEAEIRRITVRRLPRKMVRVTLARKKISHKKELGEWLKM